MLPTRVTAVRSGSVAVPDPQRIHDLFAGMGHAVHGVARVDARDVRGDRRAFAAPRGHLLCRLTALSTA